jgi:hypothetical protein
MLVQPARSGIPGETGTDVHLLLLLGAVSGGDAGLEDPPDITPHRPAALTSKPLLLLLTLTLGAPCRQAPACPSPPPSPV